MWSQVYSSNLVTDRLELTRLCKLLVLVFRIILCARSLIANIIYYQLTNEIHHYRTTKEHRYEDQYPGEVRGLEGEEPKEVIPDIRVSPAPDVDNHGCESFTEKYHTHSQSSDDLM